MEDVNEDQHPLDWYPGEDMPPAVQELLRREALDLAANATDVRVSDVVRATYLMREAPDLAAEVRRGVLSLTEACARLRDREGGR